MNEKQLSDKIREALPLVNLPNGSENNTMSLARYLMGSSPHYVHQETGKNTPYQLKGVIKKIRKIRDKSSSLDIKRILSNAEIVLGSGKKEWDEKDNEAVFSYNGKEPIFTLQDALTFSKVDLSVWEVDRHIFNSWQNVGEEGAKNIQIKIWFKKKSVLTSDTMMEDLKSEMIKYSPKYPKINYPKKSKDSKLLEISVYDLHLGRLSWGEESGQNYDNKIASERFMSAIKDLINKSSTSEIDKILFVFGNDFFNADGKSNATTEGTPQDNDVRWQKMFVLGRKLLVEAIEYMMQFAPVEVVGIYGNHAIQAEFYLGDALQCWFHNCKDVTIDNRPHTRKYIQYGECLIGMTHGHEEKVNDLPLLMATEAKEMWSQSKFREWHCGHLHSEKTKIFNTAVELKSVTVRVLRSLASIDAWHSRKGYVGCKQSAQAFVWGKDSGIEAIYYHTIK